MNQLDRQVAHRLTLYYVLALAVVATLTVRGLWFVQSTWRELHDGRETLLSIECLVGHYQKFDSSEKHSPQCGTMLDHAHFGFNLE